MKRFIYTRFENRACLKSTNLCRPIKETSSVGLVVTVAPLSK